MLSLRKLALTLMRVLPLWLAAFMFLPSQASASVTCTSNGYTSFTLNMPASVAVPRDLPNGSMLTGWASTPQVGNYFTCTVVVDSEGIGFVPAGIASATPTAYSATLQGTAVSVFPTNLPGVGIALAVMPNYGCTWGAVTAVPYWLGCKTSGTTTFNYGGQAFAALVKTGDITPGVLSGVVLQSTGWYVNPLTTNFSITPVNITVLTCQIPSKTIMMGTHKSTEFGAVGSTSSATSFTLDVNNCPAGAPVADTSVGQINSIQYRIDPSGGLVSGFTNVAALTGSTSATGIGIQLYDSTGAVLPYGKDINLAGFIPGAASSYSVPMTARYYRTGTVTGGTANTTMTVTMNYQ